MNSCRRERWPGRLALTLLLGAALLGCPGERGGEGGGEGGSDARLPPSPNAATLAMSLAAQEPDTLTVLATWEPVVWRGDTIREYRRVISRTDTAQDLRIWGLDTNGKISQVGSETLVLPGPGEGETGTYRYCLLSVHPVEGNVAGSDSACTSFQYTAPLEYPPPPDSLEANPQQTVAVDSLTLWPDSLRMVYDVTSDGDTAWLYTLAFAGGAVVDSVPGNSYQMRAEIWEGGSLVGCDGACDGVVLEPASWEEGVPVVLRGRPGYPMGQEWVAVRLPWLRQLRSG